MIHEGPFKVSYLDLGQREDITSVAALLASPVVTALVRCSVRQTGVAAGREMPRVGALSASSVERRGRGDSQAERIWRSCGRSFAEPARGVASAVRTGEKPLDTLPFRATPWPGG